MNYYFNNWITAILVIFTFSCNTTDSTKTKTALEENSTTEYDQPIREEAIVVNNEKIPADSAMIGLNNNVMVTTLGGGGFWAVKNPDLNTLLVRGWCATRKT